MQEWTHFKCPLEWKSQVSDTANSRLLRRRKLHNLLTQLLIHAPEVITFFPIIFAFAAGALEELLKSLRIG